MPGFHMDKLRRIGISSGATVLYITVLLTPDKAVLTLQFCSSTGGPFDAALAARFRTVQRPARPHSAGVSGSFICARPLRRWRRLDCVCGPSRGEWSQHRDIRERLTSLYNQILTILILNAIVGVSQESSAEKAIAALQEYSANEAKVVREGALKRIKADELVPGDVISVAVGDRIPADCRVLSIQSNSFRVDQAILTGESESVGKEPYAIKDSQAVKQDQINMLFSGTTVVTGHATALVVLTGGSTAIGDIHESITSQISEPTPLKQKLNEFGDLLAKVITVICILVWLINIQHFNDPSHGSWAKGAIYYLKVCALSIHILALQY